MKKAFLLAVLLCLSLGVAPGAPATVGNCQLAIANCRMPIYNHLAIGNRQSQIGKGFFSLCDKTEKVIFSCRIKRPAKIVSLCSSRDATKDRGYVQYRFGLPGKIELEFPKTREGGQSQFKYTHYFRAQFDETEISFSSDGHEYAIFDDYNGEEKPVRHEQGIRITPASGAKEVTLSCRGRAKADYSNLGDIFRSEP